MREYLAEALSKYLCTLDELEIKRENYRSDTAAYRNLTGSILHCEGRVKQIQETLQHLDDSEEVNLSNESDIMLEDLTKDQS